MGCLKLREDPDLSVRRLVQEEVCSQVERAVKHEFERRVHEGIFDSDMNKVLTPAVLRINDLQQKMNAVMGKQRDLVSAFAKMRVEMEKLLLGDAPWDRDDTTRDDSSVSKDGVPQDAKNLPECVPAVSVAREPASVDPCAGAARVRLQQGPLPFRGDLHSSPHVQSMRRGRLSSLESVSSVSSFGTVDLPDHVYEAADLGPEETEFLLRRQRRPARSRSRNISWAH